MRYLMPIAIVCLMSGAALPQQAPRPFAVFDMGGPSVLNDPHDLAFGPDGRLYVADKFGSRIAVLDPETLDIVEVIAEGKLAGIHDISFGRDGRVAVSVTGRGLVAVFDGLEGGDAEPAEVLAAPRTEGALVHSNGRIYASAGGIGGLVAFQGGEIVATASGHFGAHDVAEDKDGNVWIADNANRRLVKYSPDLQRLQILDHAKFGFVGPRYMDFDDFGRMVVADQNAHRVLLIDPDGPDGGTLLGVLGDGIAGRGPGKFDDPEGVAVHAGSYYISDSDNNRVVRYVVVTN